MKFAAIILSLYMLTSLSCAMEVRVSYTTKEDENSDTSSSSIKKTERKFSLPQLYESSNPKDDYIPLSDESYSEEAKLMAIQARNYSQHGEKALLFRNILVHGPKGSGKTTFACQLARRMGKEIRAIDCTDLIAEAIWEVKLAHTQMKYNRNATLMAYLFHKISHTRCDFILAHNLRHMLDRMDGDFALNLKRSLEYIHDAIAKDAEKIVITELETEIAELETEEFQKYQFEGMADYILVGMIPLSPQNHQRVSDFYLKKFGAQTSDYKILDRCPIASIIFQAKKLKLKQDMKALSIAELPAQK